MPHCATSKAPCSGPDPAGNAAVNISKPPDRAKGQEAPGSTIRVEGHLPGGAARQPLPLRGVASQELEMPKDRPSLAFFALIAASLCAAVVLVALLIAGDVSRPRVAMNNSPPHWGDRQ
jgi:hypothetical protein